MGGAERKAEERKELSDEKWHTDVRKNLTRATGASERNGDAGFALVHDRWSEVLSRKQNQE